MARSPAPPLILLVEDSDDDAFFFQRTIARGGIACEFVHVTDGRAAIAELAKISTAGGSTRRPDFIFLDLKLPALDGFEVLAWIRERQFEPPLNVIVLSGSEDAADVRRAKALGAPLYFTKPLSIQQLRACLAESASPETRDRNAPVPDRAG